MQLYPEGTCRVQKMREGMGLERELKVPCVEIMHNNRGDQRFPYEMRK